jgi:hypothetical protein
MKMKSLVMLAGLLTVGSLAWAEGPPAIPATPAAVDGLVYARTFTLDNGYTFTWSKAQPTVTTGTLLVLRVNPDLVFPRQVAEPVLYVGDSPAQRVNSGYESGYVVAIVPGEVDLTKAPIWFGTPDLPERVDATIVKAERRLANAAGIHPFAAEQVASATATGGDRLAVSSLEELLRTEVAELILAHSPQESNLADEFRVPVTAPKKASK